MDLFSLFRNPVNHIITKSNNPIFIMCRADMFYDNSFTPFIFDDMNGDSSRAGFNFSDVIAHRRIGECKPLSVTNRWFLLRKLFKNNNLFFDFFLPDKSGKQATGNYTQSSRPPK